jgi:multimeric flavodoxin WrbA
LENELYRQKNGLARGSLVMCPKVLGIAGSPVKNGNTEILIREALNAAKEEGAKTEFVSLANKRVEPCNIETCNDACGKGKQCPIQDDAKDIIDKMVHADAITMGSPVYFRTVSAQLKALMDRTLMVYYPKRRLENRLGGALAVGEGRVSGQEFVIAAIHNFYLSHKMIIVGSRWYGAYAVAQKGKKGVLKEPKDVEYARELGRRIARVAKALENL